jgi:hypothetical protein
LIDGHVQTQRFEAGSEERLEVSRTFNHLFKQM